MSAGKKKITYTIEQNEYGVVVWGSLSIDDLTHLSKGWAKQGLDAMVPGVATALGALLAICAEKDVDAWRKAVDEKAKENSGGDKELEWLYGTDTGISSKTIFMALSEKHGGKIRQFDHPHDPDDFGRCHRLLEFIPEWRERLCDVADIHPTWGPLIRNWSELTALWIEESPTGRCPKLYDRMKELIEEGRPRRKEA
jgi:hypothetical protein